MRWQALLALLVIAAGRWPGDCALAADPADRSSLAIRLDSEGDAQAVVVEGFTKEQLAALQKIDWRSPEGAGLFAVFVADGEAPLTERRSLLGERTFHDGRLVFSPRFPLAPGVEYLVVFQSQVRARLRVARPDAPPTLVAAVYPSADKLPENQLKFYLHFTAPMSRGDVYRHIRLLDDSGEPVLDPFLELPEELWDASGKRLTVLIDPGRIKRGLKPREELGPVLVSGRRYTLVIDDEWLDAEGKPLEKPFEKRFAAGPPDDVQPSIERWKIEPPPAGGRTALTIHFDEPLDHAMLQRVLTVVDSQGEPIEGDIDVRDNEQLWIFTPQEAWRPGDYSLVVDSALEDRAGNSLAKPFEVDVFREIDEKPKVRTMATPFIVK
jgi:hypothetical protein